MNKLLILLLVLICAAVVLPTAECTDNWIEVYDSATETHIYSLAAFDGYIYAGTYDGGTILRSSDGTTWTEVYDSATETHIYSLAAFDGYIYAGTASGGTILRSSDGTTWTEVYDSATETQIRSLAAFDGYIYAGTASGGTILRSSDGTTWTEVYDSATETHILSLAAFDGYIYAGTISGGTILRSSDGTTWTEVYDSATETHIYSLAAFDGYIYAGTASGGTILRSSDGTTWTEVYDSATETHIYSLAAFDGYIYAGTASGGTILRSSDGTTWTEVYNSATETRILSLAAFDGYIYTGTANGGTILRYTPFPVITLVSIGDIYQNSSGYFNISWGVTHDPAGINNSTMAMVSTSYNNLTDSYRHSIRPPHNNRSAPYGPNGHILRAENRNDTLNFENNNTITEGNIWKWAGFDENSTGVTIIPVNSTYTYVNYSGTYQDSVFNTMWYLNHQEMLAATKEVYEIKASTTAVLKMYDSLIMQGHNREFVVRVFIESSVIGNPTSPLEVWWANSSWVPDGIIDVENSPYATQIATFDKESWINYTYSPDANNDYVEIIWYGNTSTGITPGNESWIILKTGAVSGSHCYGIGVTDDPTSTNVSFADTGVLLTDEGIPLPYTPNLFICQINSDEFISKLFVADNNGAWGNLTINKSVESSYFDPSNIGYRVFYFESLHDYTMDCTYRGTYGINISVSNDPDGGVVTHNLTLHTSDDTWVATINDTVTNADADAVGIVCIQFDSSPYYSTTEMYTLKCVATDDEAATSITYLDTNFSLSPLGTSANIWDNGRLVFWGYNDIPALYTAVGNDDIISLSGGVYTLHNGTHMSQYQDTFLIDEKVHITSIDDYVLTGYYRWTGSCNISGADITSWKSGAPAPQTDKYRAYITSDDYYSESAYIINSDINNVGRGPSPLSGIYLNTLSGTLIDNNIFLNNYRGLVLNSCDNITVSNNTILEVVGESIFFNRGTGRSYIKDNIMSGQNFSYGINAREVDNLVISGNIISDIKEAGIKIVRMDNATIDNNKMYYTAFSDTVTSISIVDTDNTTISNNLVEGGQIGVYANDMINSYISNNIFYNVQYGTTLSSVCDNVKINNNVIFAREDAEGHPGEGILLIYGEHLVENNTITVSNGLGMDIWGYCDNSVFENNSITLDNDSFYCYMLGNAAEGIEILNPADDVFTVKISDDLSDVIIKNTDGRIFKHTSNYTSFGYTPGHFQLYVDDHDEFIVTQYDYTMNFASTSNITAHELESGNLARFTINTGFVDAVNVSGVSSGEYNMDDFVWNILETAAESDGYVEFVNTLFVGDYMVVPNDTETPIISDISVYNIRNNGVTVGWTLDELCYNMVYYGMDEDDISSMSAWDNETLSPDIRITELSSNTEYFYQVYSMDYYNNSNLSAVGTFTTGMSNDQMPLSIYILLIIIVFVLVGAAIVLRGNEKYIDIVAALMATFMAFMASNLAINGKVYTSEAVYSGLPAYNVLNSLPLYYLMLLIGVIMCLYTIFAVIEVIIQSYKNLTDI